MLDSVGIDGEPDGMEEIEVTELDLYFVLEDCPLWTFFLWCGGHFFLILA